MTPQTTHRSTDSEKVSLGLFVHLHPSCFSYVLKGPDTAHQFGANIGDSQLKQFQQVALSDWLTDQKELFLAHYHPTRICVHSQKFQLLPNTTLATEASFELVNPYDPLEDILYTDVIHDELCVQFALPQVLAGLLSSHFDPSDIYFGDRGLLQSWTDDTKVNEDGVYCQVMGQDITVGILQNGNMIFFNKYPVKNREDLLYYLLLCYQSNGLDAHKDPLFVSGLIEEDAPMFRLIFDYVRNVRLDKGSATLRYSDGVTPPHAAHYFINLMNIV